MSNRNNQNKRKFYNTRLYSANKRRKMQENGYQAVFKGDATENFVAEMMQTYSNIEDVEIIGNLGGMFDITYKCKNDDIVRAIQVKTLSKTGNDSWSVSIPRQYFEDTLMVFVNEERTRFGLIFYKDLDVTYLTLGFKNKKKGKYRFNKFDDLETFKRALYRRLNYSSIFNFSESVSSSILKEYYSMQRLQEKCIENSLIFKRNITNGNSVDCFINNSPAQCKYSSLCGTSFCRFTLAKSNGSLGMQPYHKDDPIDYFIFETGDSSTNEKKYSGSFCIIPKDVLVENGYLKDDNNNGKTSISVCTPDYKLDHWSKQYWNKFIF